MEPDENELCSDEQEPDNPDDAMGLSDFPIMETPVGELNAATAF